MATDDDDPKKSKPWTTPFDVANHFIKAGQDTLDIMSKAAWDTFKRNTRDATYIEVNRWLLDDQIKGPHKGGTSACGRYYASMKNTMQKWLDLSFNPGLKDSLMNDAKLQLRMRSQFMVEQFEYIDSIIRERYPDDHGTLSEEAYNNKFLTETSDNKITDVNEDKIAALFRHPAPNPDGTGEIYPHIIITSSHARGETLDDVTSITHGIEAMARDSEGKKMNHGFIDDPKGIQAGQTLTLFACDVEKSPCLNGAALMKRILELQGVTPTKPNKFKEISPGAKRIAKLMLKCMVEEADASAIKTSDERPLSQILAGRAGPLKLRADSVEVAHHFQLIGYSKGGNVVSDAMRYLVSELTSKYKAADGTEQGLFIAHEDSKTRDPNDRSMSERNTRGLVRNIAVLALASVEVGMSESDKNNGVRRVAMNSDNDPISAHHNYEKGIRYDERLIIKGVSRNVGHAPEDMMGTREGQVGFIHDDADASRRLKEFFAPNFGKSAIGLISFNGHAKDGEATIEAATGTTDRQIEHFAPVIEKTVARHLINKVPGLFPSGVKFKTDIIEPGIFGLTCKGVDFTKNIDALEALKGAFEELRSSRVKDLVIAQTIVADKGDIDKQIKLVGRERPYA